jgi:hypothetical protein
MEGRIMKPQRTAKVFLFLSIVFYGTDVRADLIGTFDENGNGMSVYTITGQTSLILGTNGVDPFDPGNGLKPLIFDLNTGVAMVNGDLVVSDARTTDVSDVFRFYTDSTSRNLLIMYSVPSTSGALADVGIPSVLQDNRLSLTEEGPEGGPNGIFNYFPTPNQPGYVDLQAAGGIGNIIYNLYSDSAVPEPDSIVMLGGGLAAVVGAMKLSRSRR